MTTQGAEALELLARLSRALVEAALDVEAIRAALTLAVTDALGDACTLRELTPGGRLVVVSAHHRDPRAQAMQRALVGTDELPDAALARRALSDLGPVRADALDPRAVPEGSPLRALFDAFPVRSVMVAPMIVQGQPSGLLAALRHSDRPYTRNDELLLMDIAHLGSLALAHARKHEELTEGRQLLDAVMTQMPSGVLIVDARGKILAFNPRNAELFHQPVGAIRQTADFGVRAGLRPDGTTLAVEEWPLQRALLKGETVHNEDLEIVRGDGTHAFLRSSAAPVRNAAGEVLAAVVVFDDVTEDRQREEALVRQQHQIQLLADTIPVVVSHVGADLRFRFVNGEFLRWNRMTREQVIGRKMPEIVGDETFALLAGRVEAVLRGEDVDFDLRFEYPTGVRFVHANYRPARTPDGTLDGYFAVVTDLTEQRRTEERARFLAEAGRALSSTLELNQTLKALAKLAVPRLADWCAIELADEGGGLETVAVEHQNPDMIALAFETRRLYRAPREVPTGPYHTLRTGETQAVFDLSDEIIRRASVNEDHYDRIRRLGFRSVVMVALRGRGEPLGVLTLVTSESKRQLSAADVTLAEELGRRAGMAVENARLYRDAQEAIRKREDFLSVASHELKTPLTALELQLGSLRRQLDRGEVAREAMQQRVGTIGKQLQRLTRLVDQLLDVSRLTKGQLALSPEPFDLAPLAREVVGRFDELAARTGTTLTLDAPDSAPGIWDRDRVDQVMTNLVGNALRYASGKPVEVTLAVDAETVTFSVKDRGIGISPEDQKRIFERFERAASARNYGGMGLGLWIVKHVVEAHGGEVLVQSEAGKGATFVVRLPRETRSVG